MRIKALCFPPREIKLLVFTLITLLSVAACAPAPDLIADKDSIEPIFDHLITLAPVDQYYLRAAIQHDDIFLVSLGDDTGAVWAFHYQWNSLQRKWIFKGTWCEAGCKP